MIVNEANLRGLFSGFNTLFNKGLNGAPSFYREVAMVVPSSTAETTYAWLGALPNIREWLGDRIINGLSLSSYTVQNKRFEVTVSIMRDKIEDDQYGIFGPMMEKMGRDTAIHPDELVFSLLASGFTTPCFDRQYFFDADHPVGGMGGEPTISVSNVQAGTGTPWYLLDCGQPLKPMLYQQRQPFEFQSLTDASNPHVFMTDEYVYGVRGRSNAGFGLWQLAYASKAELTAENYEAARAAMMDMKGDNGKKLGITPTHLVVPTVLEGAAKRLLNNGSRVVTVGEQAVAVQNEWAGSAKLVVSHHL